MARRQTEVLRNLDDTLRVMNLLSLRSCGLVMMFYSLCYFVELVTHAFTAAFGAAGALTQFALTGIVAGLLSWIERQEDEHYVPSAIRYWQERPWKTLFSGAHSEGRVGKCALRAVLRG